jgi:hypothetical protein
MSQIIFIDIDGPLLPRRAWCLPENIQLLNESRKSGNHPFRHKDLHNIVKFDPIAVSFFNTWTENNDVVGVISSNWFHYASREQIELTFKNNNLKIQLHQNWHTPRAGDGGRTEEIKRWLDVHYVDNFIIVDDDPDLISPSASILIPDIESHLLYIQYEIGLTLEHHARACNLLNVDFSHQGLPKLTYQI